MATVKAPVYNIPKILKLQRKLHDEVFLKHHGFIHTGPDFQAMVRDVQAALPGADYTALWTSLQCLAGVALLDKELLEVTWRLAGNLHNLRSGIAVPPWTRQLFPEWAPLQVLAMTPKLLKMPGLTPDAPKVEKPAVELELFILGGLAAGKTIIKLYTPGFLKHFRATFGFSRFNRELYSRVAPKTPSLPLEDIREFVRLRFLAFLTPETCEREPNYEQISCPGSMKTWNRAIMKKRRRQGFQCPKGYSLQTLPCYRCPFGYDQCQAGCHPRTFVQKPCPMCKKDATYFDPARSSVMCVNCLNKS